MGVNELKFSKSLSVDKISTAVSSYNLCASEVDCRNVAERLGIISIEKFTSQLNVKRIASLKAIYIEGNIEAKLAQPCVVSGEPVEESVNDSFESYFVFSEEALQKLEEDDPKFLEEDLEVIEGDTIDVAELVTQYLSIFMNSYPRKSDVDLSTYERKGITLKTEEEMEEELQAAKNPFQVLKSLKKE